MTPTGDRLTPVRRTTALQPTHAPRGEFYLQHTPPLRRLKHLIGTRRLAYEASQRDQAPVITPAAIAVPGLALGIEEQVPSVRGVIPRRRRMLQARARHTREPASRQVPFPLRKQKIGVLIDPATAGSGNRFVPVEQPGSCPSHVAALVGPLSG